MIEVRTVKLPTHFQKSGELEKDSRFQKVKIYIAHTGENLNNSVFTKEVFEKMIPSLANIPILGCVDNNKEGETDFRGHEKTLKLNEGSLEVKFNTNAYGFIPEDNNAHFETTGGKEWLVAEGYLWTRFIDALDIFDQSNGSKGQSMEIMNAEGYTDDLGRTVFTEAEFAGLCILGDDIIPAMTGSTISTVFSHSNVKSAFEEMLAEFAAEKGVIALSTKKKQDEEVELKQEKPTSPEAGEDKTKASEKPDSKAATDKDADKGKEQAPETPTDAADHSDDAESTEEDAEMSVKDDEKDAISSEQNEGGSNQKEDFKKDDENGQSDEDTNADTDEDEDDKKDKEKAQFEISLDEREQAFLSSVRAKYGSGYDWITLEAVYDTYGIVRAVNDNFGNSEYFRIDYSMNADDSIKLGDKTEVFSMFVTGPERDKIESDRTKLVDLEKQIEELKAYKAGIEMQAKKDLVEQNKDELTAKQVKDIEGQFAAKTVDEIEKDIAFAIYTSRKSEFSAKPQHGGVRAINLSKHDYGYGSANELFHK